MKNLSLFKAKFRLSLETLTLAAVVAGSLFSLPARADLIVVPDLECRQSYDRNCTGFDAVNSFRVMQLKFTTQKPSEQTANACEAERKRIVSEADRQAAKLSLPAGTVSAEIIGSRIISPNEPVSAFRCTIQLRTTRPNVRFSAMSESTTFWSAFADEKEKAAECNEFVSSVRAKNQNLIGVTSRMSKSGKASALVLCNALGLRLGVDQQTPDGQIKKFGLTFSDI